MLIGNNIVQMLGQVFMLNGEVVSSPNGVYLISEQNGIFHLITSDGNSEIKTIDTLPQNLSYEASSGSWFEYLIEKLPDPGGKITAVHEYLFQGDPRESCGFLLTFADGRKISYVEWGDDTLWGEHVEEPWMEKCVLVPYDWGGTGL